MLRHTVRKLATRPRVFDLLRWCLEGGYRGHRSVLQRELAGPPGRVLDCGCGTGIFAPFFPAADYTGIDVCAAYVDRARRKFPGYHFEWMDAAAMRFPPASFSRCFISGVLHHLNDATCQHILREIARILEPHGKLVIWEDIPSRHRWNTIGRLVHRLDVGEHIRTPDGYRLLFRLSADVENEWLMRSGCMDYVVFSLRPKAGSDSTEQIRATTAGRNKPGRESVGENEEE